MQTFSPLFINFSPFILGSAKDKKSLYESGQVNKQAKKTIDEEDFGVSAGKARNAQSFFEQGRYQKQLKKMIDDEELPVRSGIASETKRLIDSGHYIHSHHRTIEDEALPVGTGMGIVLHYSSKTPLQSLHTSALF